MRNVLAQAQRIWQQFSHDPRTIALFIVAPVLVLWLFSAMLGTTPGDPRLGAVDLPEPVLTALDAVADVTELSQADATAQLASQDLDAIVTMDGASLAVEVEGANAATTGRTLNAIQIAMKSLASGQATSVPQLTVTYLHGSADWTSFDFLGPVFIGIFVFIFVFITSGMSLVNERTSGTMERLLVTPIKPWQLVAGYCVGFGLVSIIQSAIILWFSISLIGFPNAGHVGWVMLITLSMSVVSMTLGLLVSALARTAFQVIQLMIVLVVPQVLLSGIFDLTYAPEWMRVLSVCFPISHGADALRAVMLRGQGWPDIWLNLIILWGFIVAFFALSCWRFRVRRAR